MKEKIRTEQTEKLFLDTYKLAPIFTANTVCLNTHITFIWTKKIRWKSQALKFNSAIKHSNPNGADGFFCPLGPGKSIRQIQIFYACQSTNAYLLLCCWNSWISAQLALIRIFICAKSSFVPDPYQLTQMYYFIHIILIGFERCGHRSIRLLFIECIINGCRQTNFQTHSMENPYFSHGWRCHFQLNSLRVNVLCVCVCVCVPSALMQNCHTYLHFILSNNAMRSGTRAQPTCICSRFN